MQVVEKLNDGLSRIFEVTINKDTLASKFDAKVKELAPKMNIKGFRPGKVPPAHVKRVYGKELYSEIIQETVSETSQAALDERKIRPASQPELKPVGDWEQVIAGSADLAYEMAVELMPEFEPIDPASVELKRPVYTPSDEDLNEALGRIVDQTKNYEAKGGKAPKAAKGDKLIIDFKGHIGDDYFAGGTAEDAQLIIGSGQFIPGFEDQLIGAKKGEERKVEVTFPEDYGAKELAGKAATFETTVKDILAPKDAEIDDELAKNLGLESLEQLKDLLKTNLGQQYQSAARFKMKRELLDILDAKHTFELPKRMLEAEFASIWAQVEQDKAQGQLSEEDLTKSEEELRGEYMKIAERRVRLGLVLAEIGTRQKVQVTDQEVSQAIMQEARNYPGQERQVFEFYQKNQAAAAQIRAPIYEEKVCDLIFTMAKVTDEPITKEELLAEEDA